ncbi:MAG: hypothetical protein KKF90_06255, partial [Alphaproteobacteria bacterium]
AAGSRLDPPDFGRLRDDRHRSGRKTLAQRAKSGELEVKRQATWGMSVKMSVLFRMRPLTKSGQKVDGGTVRLPIRFALPR